MSTLLVGDFRLPVDPKALKPKGLSGALRYWAKQGGSSVVVGITAAEVASYRAAAVPLGTIYEAASAGWMSGGAAAGKQAATYLLGQFKAVGWTPPSLYFADDSNAITNAATNACLDAAAQVLGFKPDLYAFDPELESAHSGGHSRGSWLTGHFPGATVAAVQTAKPWLHLYQCQGSQPAGIPTTVTVSGVLGDVDIVLRSDWANPGGDMPSLDSTDIGNIWDFRNPDLDKVDMRQYLVNAANGVAALATQITALSGALSKDETAILAAIQGQGQGMPVDVGALASALAPLLNQSTAQSFIDALRDQLAK